LVPLSNTDIVLKDKMWKICEAQKRNDIMLCAYIENCI